MIKLTPKQLDSKWDFVKRYMGHGNNATLSEVDPNSNISHKNVATLEGEFHKDVMVQVNRHILGQKIKEMFGKKAMKQYYRDLKKHIIYKNDETSLKPYCVAISLTPFIVNGMRGIGGESRAPEHLASFCGSYINLMYAIASQFAGAVADVSFLTYFHYFAKRDFGADYLRTHTDLIKNYFQQVIYSLNMPSGSRSYQSIFYNTSVFDREYFDALFGETLYPDGTNPAYDEVHELQKFFMDWFGAERHKAILTFPVLTAAYLSEGDHAKDIEFQEFLASQMEKGHSFFHYHSPTVDSLSSCCFDGSQEVLIRSPSSGICRLAFKELYDAKYSVFRDSGTIYHNGSWVKGKPVRLPGKPMYRITTSNKKTMLVTEDHLHATLRGDVLSSELTTDDYILCNTRALAPVPTENAQLSYEEGMLIGIYLGDGSMDSKSDIEYSVRLSLNAEKYATAKCALETVSEKYKCAGGVHLGSPIHNMYPVSINSKEICAFIREYVFGDYAQEKRLSMKALSQSIAFREGILAGYYASDGGNANRIYTTSSELVKDIECLLTSMGYVSIIDVSNRTDEAVVIRGNTYKRNFPLYCIRWYTPGNKRSMKGIYVYRNNSVYFKIVSVTRLEEKPEYVYCFEMEMMKSRTSHYLRVLLHIIAVYETLSTSISSPILLVEQA
jgi:anaerobic ribonucleoside-triphosphate reductase